MRPLPFALAWGLGLGGVLFLPPIPEGWGMSRLEALAALPWVLARRLAWERLRIRIGERGARVGPRGQAGWGTLGGKEGG